MKYWLKRVGWGILAFSLTFMVCRPFAHIDSPEPLDYSWAAILIDLRNLGLFVVIAGITTAAVIGVVTLIVRLWAKVFDI